MDVGVDVILAGHATVMEKRVRKEEERMSASGTRSSKTEGDPSMCPTHRGSDLTPPTTVRCPKKTALLVSELS